jgi:hypothetical protein
MSLSPNAMNEVALERADALVELVREITEERSWPGLAALDEAVSEYETLRFGTGRSATPFTAIDEKIARTAWVLRRLVAVTGFQAELVVYGGDYEEHGTNVHRDCRITIRRERFEAAHIKALVAFADSHRCSLVMDRHGATMRVGGGNHLELHQDDAVEANSLLGGAAKGAEEG